MLAKEQEYICATVSIRVVEQQNTNQDGLFKPQDIKPEVNVGAGPSGPLFEFAGNAPATFAERFPHLMVLAVSAAIIMAAITAEIECLRGAGYYWP